MSDRHPNPYPKRSRRPYVIKKRQVWNRDKGICQLCFKVVRPGHHSMDHIVPKSKGGTNSIKNLQLAHRKCNKAKGNST